MDHKPEPTRRMGAASASQPLKSPTRDTLEAPGADKTKRTTAVESEGTLVVWKSERSSRARVSQAAAPTRARSTAARAHTGTRSSNLSHAPRRDSAPRLGSGSERSFARSRSFASAPGAGVA